MQCQLASRAAWSRGDAVLYRNKALFERKLVKFVSQNQGVNSTAAAQSINAGSITHLITNINAQLSDAGLFIASELVRVPCGQQPLERLYLRQLSSIDLALAA